MEIKDCVVALGSACGLEVLVPWDDGTYHLTVGEMPFVLTPEGERATCVLTAELGTIPERQAEVLLKQVLRSMFMGGLGVGSWFSATEGAKTLFLNRRFALAQLDAASFVEEANRFAADGLSWREIVDGWRRKVAAGAEDGV